MKTVVLVKYVPEPTAAWKFATDYTLDRAAVEGRLSELDEYAVEQAVRLQEAGTADEIVYLTMGPAKAIDGLRKALAMGGNRGGHVQDDAIHGSDSLSTSLVLAKAIEKIGYDLVLTGFASTDGEMSVVPSMVAERLGANQATFAGKLTVEGSTVSIRRDGDAATETASVSLPAVVSVTDQTDEARYPAFKAIMAGKKKPVEKWSLGDLGIDAGQVGTAAAATTVISASPTPARSAGEVVNDDGTAAGALADFLASKGFI